MMNSYEPLSTKRVPLTTEYENGKESGNGIFTVKRIVITVLVSLLSLPLLAAPASRYWAMWDKSDQMSIKTIDHQNWQDILDRYLVVSPEGSRFRYSRVSKDDQALLRKYLNILNSTDPRLYNKKEQKAYWINLYNALTIELILEEYPVKSITKLGGWFSFGPWDKKITEVAGQSLTLNDIEHRILRPQWGDKRIHYAVNCASEGCPDLASEAYTSGNISLLLEKQARRFIQQEKGVVWIDGRLVLSRIYEWYAVDFGSREELIRHLKQYASPSQIRKLNKFTGIVDYQYNWNLNELK